ncbi:DNA-binding response regulator [Bacteroidia bacterium]|nr:DNA-binding response regulator [Bacteroidia bacterium]
MIRSIIIEDEPLLQESLKQKLSETFPNEVEIVAVCGNAENALLEIMHRRPDLIFLDIQMPGNDGLWLADRLISLKDDDFCPPEIIFTTAFSYSEYLLKAFDLAAVSYLIKPIRVEELVKAVSRYKERAKTKVPGMQNLMDAIKEEKLLKFKSFKGVLFLRPEDIAYIKADHNYAVLKLADGKEENIFESISDLEAKLPAGIFLRTGKSYIVNRKYIRQLDTRSPALQLYTTGGTYNIEVSRAALKLLKDKL